MPKLYESNINKAGHSISLSLDADQAQPNKVGIVVFGRFLVFALNTPEEASALYHLLLDVTEIEEAD
jgi:hypothetical protein